MLNLILKVQSKQNPKKSSRVYMNNYLGNKQFIVKVSMEERTIRSYYTSDKIEAIQEAQLSVM